MQPLCADMTTKTVKYQDGYKNFLYETYKDKVAIYPGKRIKTDYGSLDEKGNVEIYRKFPWDGCSGPTVATKTTIRGGLLHDFLYRLMKHGLLARMWKEQADKEFWIRLKEDRCNKLRAWCFYKAVLIFGESSTFRENRKKVKTAP